VQSFNVSASHATSRRARLPASRLRGGLPSLALPMAKAIFRCSVREGPDWAIVEFAWTFCVFAGGRAFEIGGRAQYYLVVRAPRRTGGSAVLGIVVFATGLGRARSTVVNISEAHFR
jgi:hypothetical protein